MSNLYLFTGENTFALKEELKRWKAGFLEKHGEANLQILSGKECVWRELMDEAQSQPFLAEKRLIVVEGLPSGVEKEDFEKLVKNIHPNTLIAFVEPAVDKRKSVTKFLLKNAEVKSFGPPPRNQLTDWIIQLAGEHGSTLDTKIANHLIDVVGTDQWYLKNECLKLISYNAEPSNADIDKICLPSEKHTVWILSDLIGKGSVREAAKFSKTLHKSGEDVFRLWNLFLWILSNLSKVWIYQKEKNLPLGALSKESGVPFPSAQSLMPLAAKLSREKMCDIVEHAVAADHALKTGEIKATGTEPVELVTMLEREILRVG